MNEHLELGARLREIRNGMGLSLDQTSALTGVSKTMLSQIESSKSIPTIAIVCKIANGLKIKVDSLLNSNRTKFDVINIGELTPILSSSNKLLMYCIFPFTPTSGFEIYYCIYKPGCDVKSVTHKNGNMEYLTLFTGEIELVVNGQPYTIRAGEAIEFDAKADHRYINKSTEIAISQVVLSYD